MSTPWVYVETLEGVGLVSLSSDEARHVASRRLRPGDEVVAFDAAGRTATARLARVARRAVELEVEAVTQAAAPTAGLGLASAIPKGERLAALLPMLVQLGVESWQPLVLEESVVRRLDVASPRLRRIGIEACKLARRPWAMPLLPPRPLDEVLARRAGTAPLFYGERIGARRGLEPGPAWVFVGPEAGFSADERARLEAAGAEPRALGAHNLRIETAAVAAAVAHFVAQPDRPGGPASST